MSDEKIDFTTDDLRMIADVSGWRTVASAADEIDRLCDENERLRQERAELLKIVEAPIPVKTTTCSYCAKCHAGFESKQFVHYIVIDNDCVCIPCSNTINATKEPRVYDLDRE